ncbi:MAG: hypothetical protein R2909_01710 [Gemmatimonadales bacterium]
MSDRRTIGDRIVAPSQQNGLTVLAAILALGLPALIDPGAVGRGAALWQLAEGGSYFVGSSVGLLYLWVPLVVTSSLVLVMGPGLILARRLRSIGTASEWLLAGLVLSILLLSGAAELLELLTGAPLRGRGFAALAVGLSALAAAITRRPRPDAEAWRPIDRHVAVAALVAPWLLTVLLLPKLLWETLNGDGAHAFETARLLLHAPTPFWSGEAGAIASYPGITTFLSSYPTAWFVRLFGEIEAGVRVPYLLFASAALFGGIGCVLEHGRRDQVRPVDLWLVWAALAAFTAAMAWSATYNPYHADIALPGAQDALVIGFFLGFVWAFLAERTWWAVGFGVLTYVTSPAGTILLGLWLVAALIAFRPVRLGQLGFVVGILLLCIALEKIGPLLLSALGQPVPGSEHEAGGLAKRLLNVQWRDWRRILYVVVPAGILPPISILLWRRFDQASRAVALVAMAQFAFFYLQRRTALHYYAPAMVLPLVVGWRTLPALGRKLVVPAGFLAAAVAVILSLPANLGPHLGARAVGAGLVDRMGGYDEAQAACFRRSELLSQIFPRDSHRTVPDSAYGGSPLSWFYYAHQPHSGPAAYVLQGEFEPAPEGGRLIGTLGGAALYVVSEAIYQRDRGRVLPHGIARIYRISKRTLFTG